MVLISIKSRLRAKEIASVPGSMGTDADGTIDTEIALEYSASKGNHGSRTVSVHRTVREALIALQLVRRFKARPRDQVVDSEHRSGMSATSVANWFVRLYTTLGMQVGRPIAGGGLLSRTQ